MHTLYNLGIALYSIVIRLAAPFHTKARLWTAGRKNWRSGLVNWRNQNQGPLLWIHCASLGEFEQGRPIIEQFRKESAGIVLLTFFSPSGFEPRKEYPLADKVMYLPADTPRNAREFIKIVNPHVAVFVKYEFWANYLLNLRSRGIQTISVSTILRGNQRFFTPGAHFWKGILHCVNHYFVQNEETGALLRSIGINDFTVAGDTRYDRVVEIGRQSWTDEVLEKFVLGKKVLVAGSSYEDEERICEELISNLEDLVVILAPHETDRTRIESISGRFGDHATLWSKGRIEPHHRVLIIDSMGKLSLIYRYANVALVGGGFGKGIHNVIEPAVYGIPVAFGPNWKKFAEAAALLDCGGAVSRASTMELKEALMHWFTEEQIRAKAGKEARLHTHSSTGATALVMKHLHIFFEARH